MTQGLKEKKKKKKKQRLDIVKLNKPTFQRRNSGDRAP